MSNKTEILAAPEIKQSNIETRVYDRDAQFYEYGEAGEAKTIVKNRSAKRIILTGSLAVLGCLFLFGSLATAFFYVSKKMFSPLNINQVSAENLSKDESREVSPGTNGTEQNGFESEKIFKPSIPDEKRSSESFVKNESSPRTEKPSAPKDKNPPPSVNPKETPAPSDSSVKTNAPVVKANTPVISKQVVQSNDTPVVQKEAKRQFWTSSPPDQVSQMPPISRPNRRNSQMPDNSGRFQDLPRNRREYIVEKIKQTNSEQRSKIRVVVQRQRRKN